MTTRDREPGWPRDGVLSDAYESTTLLVGIGSGHGDDAIGWRVAEAIAARLPACLPARFRVAVPSTPIGLIDLLDGVERLYVCDAFVREDDGVDSAGECEAIDAGRCGLVSRWRWPDAAIGQTSFCGTHDLSLVAVLRLAESIHALPAEVHVIGIRIEAGGEDERRMADGLSPELAAAFDQLVDQIVGEMMAEVGDA